MKVIIDYVNHAGIRSDRIIIPISIRFGSSEWHAEPQWLLKAFDTQKNAHREFAMLDVHGWVATE